MNALYSYVGMLFFKFFGVSLLVYRLPQALVGICSIAAFYILCKELFGKKAALFFSFVLTVNPWHIMMCRFGLESNLAPGMFVIGLMFFILGLHKKNVYLLPAAVFWGLTLYCYAMTWLILPFFIFLFVLFCWKWIPREKITVISIGVLFVLALPLIIFLGINLELIPEIRTPFFTIPKLTGFRGSEISIEHIKIGIKDFWQIVVQNQGDGKELLSAKSTGAYYYFTTPFMVFGVLHHIFKLFRHYKAGKSDMSIVFLIWLAVASIVSILNQYVTMIHINMVHIPIIFYGAYGIYQMTRIFKSRFLFGICIAFYAVSLVFFCNWYIHEEFSYFFDERPYEAMKRAREIAGEDGDVNVFGSSIYMFPNFLWTEKFDIEDYAENAVSNGDPYYMDLLEYRNYHFMPYAKMEFVTSDGVYVIHTNRMRDFYELGFQVEKINDTYAVAAMHIPPQ